MRAILLAVYLLSCSFAAQAATGGSGAAIVTPFDRAAHFTALDDQLAKNDNYQSLRDTLTKPNSAAEVSANLDWLGSRFQRGESVFVAYNYAMMLNEVAKTLPNETADGLRGTALASMLYAANVARIEGQQCSDLTARNNRADQFSSLLVQSDLLSLAEPIRKQAALIALAIERKTWQRRRSLDDARFLCANGMAAMIAGLRNGSAREEKSQAGQFGRNIVVTPPADFKYERLKDEVWWKGAEELRKRLPDTLKVSARIDAIPDIELVEGNFAP